MCPLRRCPTLLAASTCLQCLFRKWHSHKTFPFLIILVYWSQWPFGSLSGQLPFMLEKDNKNKIWRPHIALYQCWAARPRQRDTAQWKMAYPSVCWEDAHRAFIWVLIGWPFSLWKSHFFVISFSCLLKWKLSYNLIDFLECLCPVLHPTLFPSSFHTSLCYSVCLRLSVLFYFLYYTDLLTNWNFGPIDYWG